MAMVYGKEMNGLLFHLVSRTQQTANIGVITARLLISPTVQQCFSLVLIAATSWTNLQLEPEETCTIC